MAVDLTRKSVAAIRKEVTSGTPLMPSAGSQAIALQDGNFEIEPAFDEIENDEIRSSIGSAKNLQGLENPTASISHYIRHSGVEGTEPNYGELLESALGSVVVNATQYDTVAASTAGTTAARAIVKVDAGEGANFDIGQALLIKDGTNGYSIRNVYSISTDDLSLGFNLAAAPASGVNLGKCIAYAPVNSGHPSLTLALYRGNANSIEVLAGARISELSIEANAGEFVNGSFSLAGSSYYFDPINIEASDIYIDFLDNATTRAAVVTAKLYKDPHELADAIASAMNGLGSANTFTCTYSNSTGKFTITSNGTTLTLKWNTGTNTANSIADKIGFSTAADSSAALTYTSTDAQNYAFPYTPSYDDSNPLVAKNNEVMLGSFSEYSCFCAQSITMTIANEIAPVPCVCSESGVSEILITKREVSVEVTAILDKYDASKFKNYRAGDTVSFAYTAGVKSGGNWVAGRNMNVFLKDAVVSTFKVEDADGVCALSLTVKGFVDSNGNGEVFVNFV